MQITKYAYLILGNKQTFTMPRASSVVAKMKKVTALTVWPRNSSQWSVAIFKRSLARNDHVTTATPLLPS